MEGRQTVQPEQADLVVGEVAAVPQRVYLEPRTPVVGVEGVTLVVVEAVPAAPAL